MLHAVLPGLAAALALASVAIAQTPTAPPPPATPAPSPPTPPANPRVKVETAAGAFVVELYRDKAPVTVANYLRYVDRGLFSGAACYRASKPKDYKGDDYGLVQCGLQNDPRKVLPPIAHEPTTKTGLTHGKDGVISMGRHAPGTAQADWSIMLGDMSYLDADPKNPRATPGFAAFGQVVEGLEVIRKIIVMPTDPNKGEGAMHGEMLVRPVRILRVSRVPAAPPPAPPAPATTPSPAADGPPSI
ncbi:peptidylprolyl isomerase [Phenylobacterium kunshanense]|uniref:peptidylprolyl isomerase n=1 Tax=Phenylobacterium kunshanense TaxID=1445034 RepID=A0A328BCK7_9CAUL|nr:peptidylprolyl isomerase [Phenylobacterium kunshanense]RAK64405.1 peptidylprolyl isomerase [Phenylobacterium kunshanense]